MSAKLIRKSNDGVYRVAMLVVLAALLGPAIHVGVRGLGLSDVGGGVVAMGIVVGLLAIVRRWMPDSFGGTGRRWLFVVWVILGLTAAYRLAHLGVFMIDAQQTRYSMARTVRPFDDPELEKPFLPKHNCFTCYVIAAHLATHGDENIYQPTKYRDADVKTPIHETIGETLTIDTFQYPPPFLLLPKLLMAVGDDFFCVRSIWFGLNVLAFGITAVLLARWIDPDKFSVYWFCLPVVLLVPNTLVTLQIGNVHFLIVTLAVLGMLLLEQGRHVWGGAFLGFAIVSKIFPGVLLVYLLFRRRWKAVAFTGLAMVGFCVATLALFGPGPFQAFVEFQVPRLSSGDAFWFAKENIRAITLNASLMGMVYKLSRLDLLGELDADQLGSICMLVYTGLLILLLGWAGHRDRNVSSVDAAEQVVSPDRLAQARLWLVILALGQFRSPFLPWEYGHIVMLWLVIMLMPRGLEWLWKTMGLVLVGCLYVVSMPLPVGPVTIEPDLMFGLAVSTMTLVLCVWVALGRPLKKRGTGL